MLLECQLGVAMFLTGTFGNGLTVVVIHRTRRLHNHCTPLLLNLAIGNLLCCTTSMPVMAHQALIQSPINFPILVCKLLSLELHSLFGVSFCTLAAIALVRCLAVRSTTAPSVFLHKHYLQCLLGLTWLLPVLLAVPFYFHYQSSGHDGRLCMFFCGSRLKGNGGTSGLWELLLVTTYPGVPVLVMVVCYSLIFHQVKKCEKNGKKRGLILPHLPPDASVPQASGGLWSPCLKHPEKGDQLQSDALLHFCQVLLVVLMMIILTDIHTICFNIFLSYVACVLPATLLHLNERSNIWPPSNVPIWVGAMR